MIKFDKVWFSYKNKNIFTDFSFIFEDKTIYSLFAPSGSGKTTLLNLAAKITKPDKGIITNPALRVSYCFQEILFIEELSIYSNLELVLLSVYKDKQQRKAIIEEWLKIVNLTEYTRAYPHQLSTGMRKLVDLVRAFIYPSSVILLDEPFVGLDLKTKRLMLKYFILLWNKTKPIVILSSHDPFVIYSLSNIIIKSDKTPLIISKTYKIATPLNKRKYGKDFQKCEKFLLK